MSDCISLLCVVSWNENGFWQADAYDTEEDANSCIWFCTGKKGDDVFGVINRSVQEYGSKIKLIQGYYGECEECGCEFIKKTGNCECGGDVFEYAEQGIHNYA